MNSYSDRGGHDMLQAVAESIFQPGATPQLLVAVNIVFGCLFLTGLIITIFVTFSYHIIVLLILCLALVVSINWFVSEMPVAEGDKKSKD